MINQKKVLLDLNFTKKVIKHIMTYYSLVVSLYCPDVVIGSAGLHVLGFVLI